LDGNENWQFCPDCTSDRYTDNMDGTITALGKHSFSNVKINHYWASISYSPVTIIEKYVTLQNWDGG